jgi:hypothetical protein
LADVGAKLVGISSTALENLAQNLWRASEASSDVAGRSNEEIARALLHAAAEAPDPRLLLDAARALLARAREG